ncbi:HaaA family cyclophane-containing RiPP peptide [Streptomyces sp. NRRL WC-3626]|uniref:HaaA family cyclophane-containing RiPP peptide n=1 Tax=Streptomyces sp. NRRL WC-3626 TaxID=1463926 RepID=UPI002D21A631|nr:HaaA family cyclophane-containing RiPP peptide [Streptomyces sp. NRRL WC-3626]
MPETSTPLLRSEQTAPFSTRRWLCHEERRMQPDPSASATHAATPSDSRTVQESAVLARIESRVRERLATEQTTAAQAGDGGHAASLIRPWPL